VGRASNRKKAQRRAGPARRRSPADTLSPEEIRRLITGLGAVVRESQDRSEREAAARNAWCGGAEPVPAEAPAWPEDSLGDRFFGGFHMEEARTAPDLLTAEIPDQTVIAAAPAHWNVAVDALVRAVAFGGLALDHPAVRTLLEVLAPIAEAELAYGKAMDARMNGTGLDWDDDEPQFPEQDGPVFLLGACVLVDALWAVVGEDPLTEVRGVLRPALAAAVPGLDPEAAADALIGAFAEHYRCDLPGDAEHLQRIGRPGGDPLENLVTAGAVRPGDILPVGLAILAALAQLCRSGSASVLQPVSPPASSQAAAGLAGPNFPERTRVPPDQPAGATSGRARSMVVSVPSATVRVSSGPGRSRRWQDVWPSSRCWARGRWRQAAGSGRASPPRRWQAGRPEPGCGRCSVPRATGAAPKQR
jgi:hypothetical protein